MIRVLDFSICKILLVSFHMVRVLDFSICKTLLVSFHMVFPICKILLVSFHMPSLTIFSLHNRYNILSSIITWGFYFYSNLYAQTNL
jgi:hypothetical protein